MPWPWFPDLTGYTEDELEALRGAYSPTRFPTLQPSKGRRERVLHLLLERDYGSTRERDGKQEHNVKVYVPDLPEFKYIYFREMWVPVDKSTASLLPVISENPEAKKALSSIYLYQDRNQAGESITNISEVNDQLQNHPRKANPSLHSALQDLGEAVAWQIHLACFGFNYPDMWFPGVDEGIEPVPDDHVELVIAGMQRELNRELRTPYHGVYQDKRPAAQLNKLPWRIQRALVERRRLLFNQWGIDKKAWELKRWSFWNIHDDPDWTPKYIRLSAPSEKESPDMSLTATL